MIKNFCLLICMLACFTGFSQSCTTNPAFNGSPAGFHPDTLRKACANGPDDYNTQLDIINPTDTCVTSPLPLCFYIQATRIQSITGLPSGFVVNANYNATAGGFDCWKNGGSDPNWTSYHGCLSISATQAAVQATAPGTYPVTIIVDLYAKNQDPNSPILSNYTWLSSINVSIQYNYQLVVQNCAGVCTYTLQPAQYTATWNETSTSFTYNLGQGCPWSVDASSCNWITSIGPNSGISGPVTVQVFFDPNTSANPRTCTITTNSNQTFTLTQDGQPACTYQLGSSTASVPATATSYSLPITTDNFCQWSVTENCSWLTVTNPTGTGSGNIAMAFAANSTTTANTCTLTVAGQQFVITQLGTGCTYAFGQASDTIPATQTSYQLPVVTNAGCAWTATESCPWVTVTNPTGTGAGNITLAFPANTSAVPNICTITVQGQQFTLVQEGIACTYSLSLADDTIPASQTSYTLQVTTQSDCPWTVSEFCPWLNVTNTTGNGSGTIEFTFAANTVITNKVCTLNISGQSFELTQLGVGQQGNAPVASFTYSQPPMPCPALVSFLSTSSNSPTSYLWSFTGGTPSTAIEPNPMVTFPAPGTYAVTLTATNSAGSSTITENITVDCTVGLQENIVSNLNIYPNPTNGMLNISLELMKAGNVSLQVFNMVGQSVYSQNTGNVSGRITKQIDLSNAAPGLYLLQLNVGGSIVTRPFVVE